MIERNLLAIKNNISKVCKNYQRNIDDINIVAVSKTIATEKIEEAINVGIKNFGENYIKEAKEKWPTLKAKYPEIKLHFIGHLQSNKVKDAFTIFDCIQSVDSKNLALEIVKNQNKFQKKMPIFIQINIGNEDQKSGIKIEEAKEFINFCKSDLELEVKGLMAVPPNSINPSPFFALLKNIAMENNLHELSMGMSADYEEAIALGSNYIRIGTALFGSRI
ncbi:MAG: YggS family pyridoxal phosphate-dependent enzyme [Alphaproteobacteria bacterium]